jgi:copper chaperone CopZ
MRTWRYVLGLIALLGGGAGTELGWACERPGGSATMARRNLPSISLPRIAFNYYPPPPRYPPPPYYPTFNYFPTNYLPNMGNDYANYNPSAPVANYSLPTPAPAANTSAATKPAAALIAPPLSPRPDPVTLPAGTVRMRYLAVTVAGMTAAGDAGRIEEELGKLAGVRGVNVKRGDKGPATVKVWFTEKEPVGMAEVVAEFARLGYQATPVDG